MRNVIHIGLVLASLLALQGRVHAAQPLTEPEVKGVLISQLLKYTTWPSETFRDTNSPLVVCVIGKNPVTTALRDNGIEKKLYQKRHVVLKEVDTVQQAKPCHLLFVPARESKKFPTILDEIKDPGILTVSDAESFVAGGGIVRLSPETMKDSHFFDINTNALQRARLEVGGDLMPYAKPVASSGSR